jgi:integrase/recombinase XerC/integrase/recombinase XerD
MDIILKQHKGINTLDPLRLNEIVDSFINSLDVKVSSKLLYRRTLKQFINWVDRRSLLLSDLSRPQIIEYKEI